MISDSKLDSLKFEWYNIFDGTTKYTTKNKLKLRNRTKFLAIVCSIWTTEDNLYSNTCIIPRLINSKLKFCHDVHGDLNYPNFESIEAIFDTDGITFQSCNANGTSELFGDSRDTITFYAVYKL